MLEAHMLGLQVPVTRETMYLKLRTKACNILYVWHKHIFWYLYTAAHEPGSHELGVSWGSHELIDKPEFKKVHELGLTWFMSRSQPTLYSISPVGKIDFISQFPIWILIANIWDYTAWPCYPSTDELFKSFDLGCYGFNHWLQCHQEAHQEQVNWNKCVTLARQGQMMFNQNSSTLVHSNLSQIFAHIEK